MRDEDYMDYIRQSNQQRERSALRPLRPIISLGNATVQALESNALLIQRGYYGGYECYLEDGKKAVGDTVIEALERLEEQLNKTTTTEKG